MQTFSNDRLYCEPVEQFLFKKEKKKTITNLFPVKEGSYVFITAELSTAKWVLLNQ